MAPLNCLTRKLY